MQDFPILSQIHNEVGTVVEQISRVSDFIQAFATGKEEPPAEAPAEPEASE